VFVLVTGLPGSGKTSLATPLAAALGLPMLSKDTIKEALWDALGPGDRVWGTQLGTAAAVALESLARWFRGEWARSGQ
jgi:predicted kinase